MMRNAMLVAVLVGVSACGGEKTQTVTAPDGSKTRVTTDASGETATFEAKGPDGSTTTMVTGGGAKWPEEVPGYAAAYPGGAVQMAMSGSSGEEQGSYITFTTADAPDKVIDFYKGRAKDAGLGNETSVEAQGMRMFAATHADGRTLSIQVTAEQGTTTGVLSYGSKPG